MPRKRKRNDQQREQPQPLPPRSRAASDPAKSLKRDVPNPPLGAKVYLPILLVLAGFAVYANSLSNGFVLDDQQVIVENEQIRSLSPFAGWLTTPRPTTNLTLAINHAFGKLNPAGYHFVNVLIHVLAGLTLYGLIRRTLLLPRLRADFAHASPWIALTAAIIWLVHPLQTESVAYLSQRSEALMGLFYLLTLYCVVRGAESASRGAWFAAAIACCALGMGSKAVMVTAPIAVLLFDRAVLANPGEKIFTQRGRLYLGLAATWAILLLTGTAGNVLSPDRANPAMGLAGEDVTPVVYAITQPGAILHYVKVAFWPVSLCFDYGWNMVRTADEAMAPAVVVGLFFLWTLWGLIRRRPLAFVTAFFLLVLLPTSSFIPMADAVSEHRMYLPLASLVLIVVLAVNGLLYDLIAHEERATQRQVVSAALAIIVVGVLGWYTLDRNRVYADSITVWQDVVSKRPNNVRAKVALGRELYERGDRENALQHLREAVTLEPENVRARFHLGKIYLDSRNYQSATIQLQAALEGGMETPEVYLSYGAALIGHGRLDEAIDMLDMATMLKPDYVEAYMYLGNARLLMEQHEEALWYYDRALAIDPEHVTVLVNKGVALLQMHQNMDAIMYFDRALEIDPNSEAACESRLAAQEALNPDEFPDTE